MMLRCRRRILKPKTVALIVATAIAAALYVSFINQTVDTPVEELPIEKCIEPSVDVKAFNEPLYARVPQHKAPKSSRSKLVLLWTKYFGKKYSSAYYFFQPENSTFVHYKCSVSNCAVTDNRSLITEADAVLFHIPDFSFKDLPKHRFPNQMWVYYNVESPTMRPLDWKRMNKLFNWTMTYRRDSDIVVKHGEVCRIPKSRTPPLKRNYLENKTKEVAWFVSDCRPSNNRQGYVKELSKHINVDIYGKCGKKSCRPPGSRSCYDMLSRNYKFYLSFENSICLDYITEKFYNLLDIDVIPVVMGGGDYEKVAPPHSYINVFDFDNPQKLAEYLKNVGNNENLYNSYFDWKGKYKVYLVPWMCDLCEKLHATKANDIKVVGNLDKWWREEANCLRWEHDNTLRKALNRRMN